MVENPKNPKSESIETNKDTIFPFLNPNSFETPELYEKAKQEYLNKKPIQIIPHEVLSEKGKYGTQNIRFKANKLEGVVINFGKVEFIPREDGTISLSYDYDADLSGATWPILKIDSPETKKILEKELGDFLMSCIEEQLKQGKILFRGGSDEMEAYVKERNENRNNDTEKSSS